MTSVQAINTSNVQYVIQTQQEDKNIFEGIMWGVNGIQNLVAALTAGGSALALDVLGVAAISGSSPNNAIAGAVGLAALNVLAYYIVKGECSIASKSFTHMKNTIW